jgi:chemotaxis protein methyltransferase CheR
MNAVTSFAESLPGISPGIYCAADFKAVGDITYAEAGIVLNEGKAMLVYSRLAPLVRDSGCATFASYVIRIREDAAERNRAIMALTTNHTFFNRESHHFDHFAETVRPLLIGRLERKEKVRLWSAGSSSGEETWSLLMTLLGPNRDEGLRITKSDLRLLGSDIADHALSKAEAARYRAEDLKVLPEALTRIWSQTEGEFAQIAPEVRALAKFRTLNLLGQWPMKGQFDVIFCRNVMIYFDGPTKERLVERFANSLAPGGYLYVGHSERVTGPALDMIAPCGPTIYRRKAS